MSTSTVVALKGSVDSSFQLLDQFITVCPEEIWAEKFGGWPVWQQVAHALSAVGFFVDVPQAPAPAVPAPEDVCNLDVVGVEVVPKSRMAEALAECKKYFEQYAAALKDEDLPQRNEPLFQRAQFELTHAGTLSLLAGHNLYHLGAGDAALRQHGLKGVF